MKYTFKVYIEIMIERKRRFGNFRGQNYHEGSGNVSVHVDNELEIELRGTGNLFLNGSPRVKRLELSGTGTVRLYNN